MMRSPSRPKNCKTFANYRIAVPGIKSFFKFFKKFSGASAARATVELSSSGAEAPSQRGSYRARVSASVASAADFRETAAPKKYDNRQERPARAMSR
jgi:hypothetical protein